MSGDDDDMRDRPGTRHDDGLSKRTHFGGVPFSDLAGLNENTRVMIIGRAAQKQRVAFVVESDAVEGCVGKADRYVKKLKLQFPELTIIKGPGPSPMITQLTVFLNQTKADFLRG